MHGNELGSGVVQVHRILDSEVVAPVTQLDDPVQLTKRRDGLRFLEVHASGLFGRLSASPLETGGRRVVYLRAQRSEVATSFARVRDSRTSSRRVDVKGVGSLEAREPRCGCLDPDLDLLHVTPLFLRQRLERSKQVAGPKEVDRVDGLGELGWERDGLLRLHGRDGNDGCRGSRLGRQVERVQSRVPAYIRTGQTESRLPIQTVPIRTAHP